MGVREVHHWRTATGMDQFNAVRQRLFLVKFKSIMALRSIEGLRQDGFLPSFPWYEVDLDGRACQPKGCVADRSRSLSPDVSSR